MTVQQGIDVSNWQGPAFAWPEWRGKISFAFAKATENVNFEDPDYHRNLGGMMGIGVVPGAYHVLHGGSDGAAQARYFLSYAKPSAGTLLMVDYEPTTTDGRGATAMSDIGAAFADVVRSETGAWPIAYSDISMVVAGYLNGLKACPLFLANPSRVPTRPPIGPWGLVSFEQTAQRGVDTDVFYGDLPQLRKLTAMHAPGSISPPPAPLPPPPPAPLHSWRVSVSGGGAAVALVPITSTDSGRNWH